ncbi:MAG: hypothetical protein QM758_24300 [Armatimonas sp.]
MIATRLTNKLKSNFELQDDSPAELKRVKPTIDYSPFKVRWRIVVAKGVLHGNQPQKLNSPDLDCTDKSFLTELAHRYPKIQFSSPNSGEDSLDEYGSWFSLSGYQFFHPELDALEVSISPGILFASKANPTEGFFVADMEPKLYHCRFESLPGIRQVADPPLFEATLSQQKSGKTFLKLNQTILVRSESYHFEQGSKKLQPVGTHMLFCRVVKPGAP